MNVLVIGGDVRLHHAAATLSEAGHTVRLRGTPPTWNPFPSKEDFSLADAWLLPVPVTRGNTLLAECESPPTLTELASHARAGLRVFGGKVPEGFRELLEGQGAEVWDYFDDPVLTLENAYLTAEGALFEWMRYKKDGVRGAKASVLGYGRIAKSLVRLLTALQVRVTVYARKGTDLADAALCGCGTSYLSSGTVLAPTDAVFNTVPARIFAAESFRECRTAPVFDLADGIPPAAGGAALIPLRGVPGKYAPKAAGRSLAEAVLRAI